TIHDIAFGSMFHDVQYIEIHADGFLRHMVRSMMGTLMDVAIGKKDPEDIPSIIAAKDRSKAGQTAPANGLFLWDVFYE
ncbi:MAG: tRNA pseudouridine(38-40) synthase TruA, partial [Deltaproteobacteria bacterium]|nr:tRNA pseudouridine(38-40) synthase TruA [Deltaproteobacteria bacterium]